MRVRSGWVCSGAAAFILALIPLRSALSDSAPLPEMRKLEHGWQVLSVAFSPDGRLLASGSADRTAKIWDARSGKLKRTLPEEC